MSIYKKLLSAKAEFTTVVKNATNPFHKSKYADLNAFLDAIEPALIKHGLLLTQPIVEGSVVTQIIDAESTLPVPTSIQSSIELPQNLEPQKLGAAITYFRRYTLQSLLALNAEDDDGQSTMPTAPRAPMTPVRTIPTQTQLLNDPEPPSWVTEGAPAMPVASETRFMYPFERPERKRGTFVDTFTDADIDGDLAFYQRNEASGRPKSQRVLDYIAALEREKIRRSVAR